MSKKSTKVASRSRATSTNGSDAKRTDILPRYLVGSTFTPRDQRKKGRRR